MSRFSRLFGQEAEKSSSPVPGSQAGNQPNNQASSQGFGLQLILDSGEARNIQSLPLTIGRSEQNNLVLKDDAVSSNHARIYYDELVGSVCIVDTDSLNGTYINSQPTRKNVLSDGCQIRLGKTNLIFRDTGYIHPG